MGDALNIFNSGSILSGDLGAVSSVGAFSETMLYISLPLFMVYLVSFLVFKRNVLLVSAVFFGVVLFASIIGVIAGEDYLEVGSKIVEYQMLVIGFVHLLLGFLCSKSEKHYLLTWPFYFLGASVVLTGGLLLTVAGVVDDSIVWQILYPILLLGIFSLTFVLKKVWFVIATLVGFIAYLTILFTVQGGDSNVMYLVMGIAMIVAGQIYFYAKRRKLTPVRT